MEAGLAGAIIGAFQGLIFAGVLAFASPMGFGGSSGLDAFFVALIALVVVGGFGAVVGATLGSVIAALQLRRE